MRFPVRPMTSMIQVISMSAALIIALSSATVADASKQTLPPPSMPPHEPQPAQPDEPPSSPAHPTKPPVREPSTHEAAPDAAPGEAHARFDALIGRWDVQTTTWGQEQEPARSTGVARYSWVLEHPGALRGRFLRQEFRTELSGAPYQALGYWGHDNIRNHYFCNWMDTLGTSVNLYTGAFDSKSRALTLRGVAMTSEGERVQKRLVLTIHDDTRHTVHEFQATQQEPERKVMEIIYTRPQTRAVEEPPLQRNSPGAPPADTKPPDEQANPPVRQP